jgi:hypothetical protein
VKTPVGGEGVKDVSRRGRRTTRHHDAVEGPDAGARKTRGETDADDDPRFDAKTLSAKEPGEWEQSRAPLPRRQGMAQHGHEAPRGGEDPNGFEQDRCGIPSVPEDVEEKNGIEDPGRKGETRSVAAQAKGDEAPAGKPSEGERAEPVGGHDEPEMAGRASEERAKSPRFAAPGAGLESVTHFSAPERAGLPQRMHHRSHPREFSSSAGRRRIDRRASPPPQI